jgi:hypothetical protein
MSDDKVDEKSSLSGVPLVVAASTVVLWAIFVVLLVLSTDSSESRWLRLTFIFGSVQAIAFAAAGALFGVAVQENRVRKAEKVAEANAKDAENGRALAINALTDDAVASGGNGAPAGERFGTGGPPERDVRRRHAQMARRLFPDL